MREIKFRAWDKKRKEWVHKQACSILGETILLCGWMQRPNGHHVRLEELNDIEVQQYTGLKDKNGVEIYEGDIIKAYYGIDNGEIYQVEYGKGMFELNDIRNNETFGEKGEDYYTYHRECISIPRYIEVIGNIYENHELLN